MLPRFPCGRAMGGSSWHGVSDTENPWFTNLSMVPNPPCLLWVWVLVDLVPCAAINIRETMPGTTWAPLWLHIGAAGIRPAPPGRAFWVLNNINICCFWLSMIFLINNIILLILILYKIKLIFQEISFWIVILKVVVRCKLNCYSDPLTMT